MTKILKFTSLFLVTIILLLIAAAVILVTCVSPNKFKPIITAQVAKFTGRQLVIDGDLSWSFFPNVGVKVGHATLSNPPGFKQKIFAEMDQATIAVKLMPLLHAKIEASGIVLSGMTINLEKNANGDSDWQMMPTTSASSTIATQPGATAKNDVRKKTALSIEIPSVDINDAHVTWTNAQSNQYADINHFNLHAENISLDHDFPISTTFNFKAKNPDALGSIALDGNIQLNLDAQRYQITALNLTVKAEQHQKTLAVNIKGDLIADLAKQTLTINQLVTQLSNVTLTGQVNVTDLSTNARVQGHLQTAPFDLKQLLQSLGQDTASLQVAQNVSADFDFSTTPSKTLPMLQTLNVEGKMKVGTLVAAKLKISEITIATQMHNGVVDLSPVTASLYQGSLTSQAKINLTTSTPQFNLHATLNNVQAEPLLQDLGSASSKIKVKGVGNVEMQVTTAGTAADTIIRNLNGTGHLNFANGQLDGVNIGYYIDSAIALIHRDSPPAQNDAVTNFGSLTGSVVIRNGVVSNNDLLLDSPRFKTKGQGTINLVSQQIDYKLEATPAINAEKNNSEAVNNLIIPIMITGSLSAPSVRLDTGAIAQQVAKQQIQRVENNVKKKIQDKISEQVTQNLQNQVPGKAGAMLQNLLGQ